MTTIPDTTKPGTSGLVLKNGYVYARYSEDGKQRLHSLGPHVSDTDFFKKRDKFYAALLKGGAIRATRTDRRAKVDKDPDKYIRKREPYVVVIAGKVVAECSTRKAAREARDGFLNVTGDARRTVAIPETDG